MRSSSRLQLAVVLVCVYCHLVSGAVYGQECGANPMKQVLMVAKRTGRTLTHVLDVLRDIDAPAYRTLAQKFRMYAACVGLVDTGYFRKRAEPMEAVPVPEAAGHGLSYSPNAFLHPVQDGGHFTAWPHQDENEVMAAEDASGSKGGVSRASSVAWMTKTDSKKELIDEESLKSAKKGVYRRGKKAKLLDDALTYLVQYSMDKKLEKIADLSDSASKMPAASKKGGSPRAPDTDVESFYEYSDSSMELPTVFG